MAFTELDRMRIHLDGERLFGETGSPESLRATLSQLSSSGVIQTAAKIVHFLERPGSALDRERQITLLELFPPAVRGPLEELLTLGGSNGGVDVLFHRQQMLALQKLALAVGDPGTPPSSFGAPQMVQFLRAATQTSDVIGGFAASWAERDGSVLPIAEVALWKLRAIAMGRNVSYSAEAGRAWLMWVESRVAWPDGLEDPDSFVGRVFGCTLERALAIGAAPAFSAMTAADKKDPQGAVLNPGRYFKETAVDVATAVSVLRTLTQGRLPPEAVDDEATYTSWADVAARPYLPAGDSLLTVASPALALVRATTGIFWMLHESAVDSGRVHHLTSHFGRMFEDYALRLAESLASDTLLVSPERWYGSPVKRSSDVLLCQLGPRRQARIFVEVGAVRPRRSVIDYGDVSDFHVYLRRIADKLKQLDRSIMDHVRGEYTIPSDPLSGNVPYIPMLVIDEPFTWSPELRDVLDVSYGIRELFRHPAVAKPVVCSMSEFEHLVHALNRSEMGPAELLTSYLMGQRDIPLEAFLFDSHGLLNVPSVVLDGFDSMMESWLSALRLAPKD